MLCPYNNEKSIAFRTSELCTSRGLTDVMFAHCNPLSLGNYAGPLDSFCYLYTNVIVADCSW